MEGGVVLFEENLYFLSIMIRELQQNKKITTYFLDKNSEGDNNYEENIFTFNNFNTSGIYGK